MAPSHRARSAHSTTRTRPRARPGRLDTSSSSSPRHRSSARSKQEGAATAAANPKVIPSSFTLDPDTESDLDASSGDDGAAASAAAASSRISSYCLATRSPLGCCPDSQVAQARPPTSPSPPGPSRATWSFPTQMYERRSASDYHSTATMSDEARDDEDEDDEEQLELPPGNQQAVPRAFLLEVATSNSTPGTIRSALSASSSTHQRSSPLRPPPSAASRDADARDTPSRITRSPHSLASTMSPVSFTASPAAQRQLSSPIVLDENRLESPVSAFARRISKGKAVMRSDSHGSPQSHVADVETDLGQGSLHRGKIVPSSDLEDNDDVDGDDLYGPSSVLDSVGSSTSARRRPLQSGAADAARSRTRASLPSTQDILRRRPPAFCSHRFNPAPSNAIVAETQLPPRAHSEAASSVLPAVEAMIESDGEEYDEDAHMRDSAAAAADESLLAPRPRARKIKSSAEARVEQRPSLVASSARSRSESRSRSHSRALDDSTAPIPVSSKQDDEDEVADRIEPTAGPSTAITLTPPPPTPPPALKDLAAHFAFAPRPSAPDSLEPPKLEARAEQCEIIQIQPWHRNLGRGRGRGRGRGGAAAGTAGANRENGKGKGKAKQVELEIVDTVDLDADVVDLSAIPLEVVRPLGNCPICGVGFPKSRTGPAKRTHMGACARRPPVPAVKADAPAAGAAAEGGAAAEVGSVSNQTKRARPDADAQLSSVGESSITATTQIKSARAPLTPAQVFALINTHLDALITVERDRRSAIESSKTLFACVVGDEAAAEAANTAARAKVARDRQRKLHLDNLYAGQEELPDEYQPRKRRRKGKGKGKGAQDEEAEAGEKSTNHRALMRLMAKRDAETAKRRQAILEAAEEEEVEMEQSGAKHPTDMLTLADLGAPQVHMNEGSPAIDVVDEENGPSRTRRSPSLAPSHVSASTATASSTAWSPLKAQRLAELGTSLVPASEGRARAFAVVQEMFPPTQRLGGGGDGTSAGAGAFAQQRGSWLGRHASAVPDSQGYGGGGFEEDEEEPDGTFEESHHQQGYTDSPNKMPRSDSGASLLRRRSAAVLGARDDNASSERGSSARASDAEDTPKQMKERQDSAKAQTASDEEDDDDRPLILARPIIFSAASPSHNEAEAELVPVLATEVALPPSTQRFGRSRLADKYALRTGASNLTGW